MRPAHGFASRVVLIGSSGDGRAGREVIAVQLTRLRDLLVDSVRWGLDRDNCILLVDPETGSEVQLALKTAAEGVSRGGLLLVHYVGPVRLSTADDLLLTFPGHTFRYDEIRWRVKFNRSTRRLVVLDCRDAEADAEAVADVATFERGVLLVHATKAGGTGAGFTGHVVDLLDRGQPQGPTLLGPQALRQTFGGAVAMRPPGTADSFALIRNPALFHADREGQIVLTGGGLTGAAGDDAVILILRYDPEGGTMGVVLNRPGAVAVTGPNWPGAVHDPAVVFDGGPVPHEGFIPLALLHVGADPPATFRRVGHPAASRLGILPLTTRPAEQVVERYRLFHGYVGWGPGELEADIASGSVVLGEMDLDMVLRTAPGELRRLAQERG